LYPHAVQAFSIDNYYNSTNQSNILIHNNTINYAGRGVIYGEPGYLVNNVQVYNNHWTGDAALQTALWTIGYHGDGLMIGCRTGCSAIARVSNIQFYNNTMDGSWAHCTALYYSDGDTSNTLIYNNIFATENTTAGAGTGGTYFIRFNADGNDSGTINILNNTFSSDSLAPLGYGLNMSGAVQLGTFASGTSSTITIENNIFSGSEIDVLATLNGVATLTMDYNLHNPHTASYGDWAVINSVWYQYANLAALHTAGYENHSVGSSSYSSSYPSFVTVPTGIGTGNWQLQSNSPAIGVGTNLSTTFTTDLLGNARPTGANTWDIGAYEEYGADSLIVLESSTGVGTDTNSGKSGCFIATAAYGSYLDPHVYILRNFRDNYLLTNYFGKRFVEFYYRNSPPVAKIIASNEILKTATRWALTPVVYSVEYPYVTLMLLLSALVILI
jgi:hypothetical protein